MDELRKDEHQTRMDEMPITGQQAAEMNDMIADAQLTLALQPAKIGKEDIRKAMKILRDYKEGKQNLENKIVNNEKWFKQRHWQLIDKESTKNDPKPASGWLFNTILNKHADFMDAYPQSDILPREIGDIAEAEKLSNIIPVIMEQNDYESEYSDEVWYKLKHGTGVFGIFWDQNKLNGLGDISIKDMDMLNLFWEPGISDIQKSRNFFSVELVDNEVLEETYPDLIPKGSLKNASDSTVKKYMYDENIKTDNKSLVVDWYYKKDVDGHTVLHYCKFVNETVLYATENDTELPTRSEIHPVLGKNGIVNDGAGNIGVTEIDMINGEPRSKRGWYDHGMYPFVFDVLFPEAGMPFGFGFIDICKSPQISIDVINNAIEKNASFGAQPRYFVRNDSGINEEELNDPNCTIVHVDGNLGQDELAPIQTNGLNGNYMEFINNKINEMKETSGNRDTSNGGTQSGVTAASAIAAMQEQAGKTSRDMIKTTYRAHKEVVNFVIELIRQFYDVPRVFRIIGEQGAMKFINYDNSGLKMQSQGTEYGIDMGYRLPVFDIKIEAEKESPYSQMSQNELALQFYNAGFFNPAQADQALTVLEMMKFQGKDAVTQKIAENGTMYQQLMAMQQQMLQMAQIIDQQNGTNMADEIAGAIMGEAQAAGGSNRPLPKLDVMNGENSIVTNARERAAESTVPR